MYNHTNFLDHDIDRCYDGVYYTAGADPGFDQGRAQIVTGQNCRWCAAALCK